MALTPKEHETICKEKSFQAFFNTHANLLRNFLYYKFGNLVEAEDIVQDAFIKLWDNCSKVTTATAKSYLFKIAINQSTSALRHNSVKLKHQKEVKHINNSISNQSPEYLLEEKEFKIKLEKAISALPDRQREVFLLNRIEKKTYREIAELSGVSVKAIEKLMHKALLKLRANIKNIP